MEKNQLIFKLSSIMLRYPDKAWVENEEILELISTFEDEEIKESLLSFWSYVRETSWQELAENYVRWFDLAESTTMYLTYGIFGDNQERGPALVQLKMEYAKAGFYIKDDELPDYLPLILEFASVAEPKFVKKVLAIHRKAIGTLQRELKKEQNPYHHLVDACMMAMETLMPRKHQEINHHAG